MRAPLPAAAAMLLALALAPAAHGHGGAEFPHVNPLAVDLAAGENRTLELTFTEKGPGGKFEAGWVFIINADVAAGSAPVDVTLHPGHLVAMGPPAAAWRLTRPGAQQVTGPMPVEDVYTLVLRHGGGPGRATLTFFYDQSCNCAGKPIPFEVPRGIVVFNADVAPGSTWMATFPEPRALNLSISLAQRTDERSRWPEDFRVLARSGAPVVRDVGAGPARLHEMTWTAEQGGRYYFFVQAAGADVSKVDPRNPGPAVFVTPRYEQLAAASKPAPLDAALVPVALAAAALGLAAAARRR